MAAFLLRRYFRLSALPPPSWRIEIALIPIALALRAQSPYFSAALVTLLLLVSFARRRSQPIPSTWWVAAVLLSAAFMVLLRSTDWLTIAYSLAASALIVRTAVTSDKRTAISAMLDGVAIYLVANVAAYYLLGLRSPAASNRTGGLEGLGDAARVFFPFTTSLNLAPALAACAVSASLIILERGACRRVLRQPGAAPGGSRAPHCARVSSRGRPCTVGAAGEG